LSRRNPGYILLKNLQTIINYSFKFDKLQKNFELHISEIILDVKKKEERRREDTCP
jgi:hypothetical protein